VGKDHVRHCLLMSAGNPKPDARSKKLRDAAKRMPKWKACSLIAVFLLVAGSLLWMGLAIVVRCERVREDRVDVTIERRFLGVLPLSKQSIPDVTDADVAFVFARTEGGEKQRRGFIVKLALTPREQAVCVRSRFGPAFGAQPQEMVAQIDRFISERTENSLTTWWMPWLVNLFAIPFILLTGATLGETFLRTLGFLKRASSD
jgi:hypothetical protein